MSPTRDSTSAGLQHKIKDLQRQLAESTAERDEGLAREAAVAEVLGVINSSPGELQPVFEAILEKAHSLCGVASGALQLYDGEKFRAVATNGLPEPLAKLLRDGLSPGSSQQRVVAGEADVIHIADLAASDSPRARHVVEIGGVRTLLYVALRKDQKLLGVISASRFEVRPFSEKEIALLQNFAAQAVIAMENARLLGELQARTRDLEEALEYQTGTSGVLNVISRSTADVQPVLDTVVETAARLCDADSVGILMREGDVYRYVSSSWSATDPERWAIQRQRTVVPGRDRIVSARAALEGRIVHVADIRAEPEFAFPETVAAGRRTMLGVPLLREGAVIGTINLGRNRVLPFTERQIELVRTFADQAVIAIENARLLGELRHRTEEVAVLNRGLEARVAEQVEELGRVGRLKRFLAPQLAELIVSQGDEKILESHRREIVVVFCDLRGYTAFTETAEPEEVLDFLREYHGALGPLVSQFEGTLDQFSGDGIMVFFNDPVPCPDPAERAVKMAMAMRETASTLIASWRRRGRLLGFGAGIAQGYATLGQIGFAERSGYTAIGTVCNLAARLCAEAKDGQILIGQRVAVAVEETTPLEEVGELTLKGLSQPVVAYNVALTASDPAFRVIEGGPLGA
jgi:class 3 adenylate cyclase